MKKSLIIVDWILIIILAFMVLSKFVSLPFAKLIQPLFLAFIVIHIIQHWKILVLSLKPKKKSKK